MAVVMVLTRSLAGLDRVAYIAAVKVVMKAFLDRDISLIRKRTLPWDPPRILGIGLREGPGEEGFLMSGVPL